MGFRLRLCKAVAELHADQQARECLDWHPETDKRVLDLVHPSLYPFIYRSSNHVAQLCFSLTDACAGSSNFIEEEVVGVQDAIMGWAGKGAPVDAKVDEGYFDDWDETGCFYSTSCQWLPSNLEFRQDGCVRFTSYINNLHPNKYQHIYRLIEELADIAVPAWSQLENDSRRPGSRYGSQSVYYL
jgi:hypothetical protein